MWLPLRNMSGKKKKKNYQQQHQHQQTCQTQQITNQGQEKCIANTLSPSTTEPCSKIPNQKITPQHLFPTETESSNSKMTSDSLNKTTDNCALTIDENEANITKKSA